MKRSLKTLASSQLYSCIYLNMSTNMLSAHYNLSPDEAVQAVIHYSNNKPSQNPKINKALDQVRILEESFLASCNYPGIVNAIKTHNGISEIIWIQAREDAFRARDTFLDLVEHNSGYQSEFSVNLNSRKKDEKLKNKLLKKPEVLNEMEVSYRKGLLFKGSSTFDTAGYVFKDTPGEAGFVITKSNTLYMFSHINEKLCSSTGKTHLHSMFTSGTIFFAGSIVVKNGIITSLTDYSGHYNPSFNISFILWLEKNQLLTNDIVFEDFNQKGVFNTICNSIISNPTIISKIAYLRGFKEQIITALKKITPRERSIGIINKLINPIHPTMSFKSLYDYAVILDNVISNDGYMSTHASMLRSNFYTSLNSILYQLNQPLLDLSGLQISSMPSPMLRDDISKTITKMAHNPRISLSELQGLRLYAEEYLDISAPASRALTEIRVDACKK